MAWEQQDTKTPTSIGPVFIRLCNENGTTIYRYNVVVLDQNGDALENVVGNLEDIVTPGRIQQALGILTDVRQKAESELLP